MWIEFQILLQDGMRRAGEHGNPGRDLQRRRLPPAVGRQDHGARQECGIVK